SQHLHDFTVAGGGIYTFNAAYSRLTDIDCVGCDLGFFMLGDSHQSEFDRLSATGCGTRGRYGFYTHTGNGDGFHDLRFGGQVFPFVSMGSAEQIATNLSVTAGPAASAGLYLDEGYTVLDNPVVDATNAGSAWTSAIVNVAPSPMFKFHIQGGSIGHTGSAPVIDM